jgi:hypothetical protein
MKVGHIYCYSYADPELGGATFVLVYKMKKEPVKTVKLYTGSVGETLCAIAVNIQDLSDIRTIPQEYWQYWKKIT